MFSIHAGRGGIGNYSLLCCFCRRLFVLLSSRFSSIVIALGWERGHDYRSWRRAASTSVLELNISSSEQPSSPLLSSFVVWEWLSHIQAPCSTATVPFIRYGVHACPLTCTKTHTQRSSRYKSSLSCIDPASAEHQFCTFVLSVFPNVSKPSLNCKIKLVLTKQPASTFVNFFLDSFSKQFFFIKRRSSWAFLGAKTSICQCAPSLCTAASVKTQNTEILTWK